MKRIAIVVGLIALVGLTLTCAKKKPAVPLTPIGADTTYSGTSETYRTVSTDPKGRQIRYAFDWDDGTIDTTAAMPSSDTAVHAHTWTSAGTYFVAALAITEDGRESESWSMARNVTVLGNRAPNAPDTIEGPIWIWPLRRDTIVIRTSATDADGDSVYIRFHRDTTDPTAFSPWYGPVAGGTMVCDTLVIGRQSEFCIVAYARDTKGAVSAPSEVYHFFLPDRRIGWVDSSDNASTFGFTPAIIARDDSTLLVFAGADGDSFFRFTDNGSERPGQIRVDPCRSDCVLEESPVLSADNQRLYLAWGDGRIYSLSLDLDILSEYVPDTARRIFAMPAVSGPELYAGREDSLYSLHDANGILSRNWAFGAGSEITMPPVVTAAGNIVFGTDSSGIFCVTPTGIQVWNTRLPAMMNCGAAIGADGRVYIGCDNGRLYGLDLATGDTVFSSADSGSGPAGSEVVGSPVIDASGTVYICRYEGSVTAYPPGGLNTTCRWLRVLPNSTFSSGPCLAPDTTIVVHNNEDYLYAVWTTDGEIRWPFKLPTATGSRGRDYSGVGATPVIGPYFSSIYVGSACDRYFFAVTIGEDAYPAGMPAAPWPKFQRDLGNRGNAGTLLP